MKERKHTPGRSSNKSNKTDVKPKLNASATRQQASALTKTFLDTEHFATVLMDSNDAVIMHDYDGKILVWNRGATKMYGYTKAEVLGMNVREMVAEDHREDALALIAKIKTGKRVKSFELKRITKDGRVLDVWLTITKLTDEAGNPVGIATTERDITERNNIMRELKTLATVMMDSNDAVIMHDYDGKILVWNRGATKMYGYTKAEALGMNVREMVAEDHREDALALIAKIKTGKRVKSFELKRITRDGRVLDVWLTITKLTDEAGNPVGIATTERDITERKQEETATRKAVSRFTRLTASLNDVVWSSSTDGTNVFDVNSSFKDLYGVELEEYKKNPNLWIEMVHPDDRAIAEASGKELYEKGKTKAEYRIIKPDDTIVWLLDRKSLINDENGKPIEMGGIATDITERKQAVEELKASNQRLLAQTRELSRMATVVKDSNDTITIQDLEGNITAWNAGAKKMYGYSEKEAVKMNVADLVPRKYKAEALNYITSLKKGKLVESLETKRLTKDGKILDVWMVVTRLVDEDGKLIGAATTERDITERNRTIEALEKALQTAQNANAVKDNFIANISHEFRTPLNSILGFSDLIAEEFEEHLDDENRIYFESIRRSGDRLTHTVGNILELSRYEAGDYRGLQENIDLVVMLRDLIKEQSIQAAEKGLSLNFEASVKKATITVDEYSLSQALMNIYDNAIKYTEKGGVNCTLDSTKDQFVLKIKDTGVGISKDYLKRIFDPYTQESEGYTKRYQGLGLGMALCVHYLDYNNVKYDISSKLGEGTEMTLHFNKANITKSAKKQI